MAKKIKEELKEKSIITLTEEVKKLKAERMLISAKIRAGEEQNLKKDRDARRKIARILTIITQKTKLETRNL